MHITSVIQWDGSPESIIRMRTIQDDTRAYTHRLCVKKTTEARGRIIHRRFLDGLTDGQAQRARGVWMLVFSLVDTTEKHW